MAMLITCGVLSVYPVAVARRLPGHRQARIEDRGHGGTALSPLPLLPTPSYGD